MSKQFAIEYGTIMRIGRRTFMALDHPFDHRGRLYVQVLEYDWERQEQIPGVVPIDDLTHVSLLCPDKVSWEAGTGGFHTALGNHVWIKV